MWTEFVLAFAVSITILYLLGFLLLRVLRFNLGFSVLFAPIASITVFAILTTLYGSLHIPCNVITVLATPIVLLLAILTGAHHFSFTPKQTTLRIACLSKREVIILLLYILIGLLICCIFYIKPLDGPSSFFNRYDNITHINYIRAFIESGIWSSFSSSSYLSSSESPLKYTGSFYPSGWHYIVALTTQILQSSITTNINAVNAVFIGIIYPSSIFILLHSLFKKDRTLLICGSVIALAFTAFPWGFFFKGPLYPNLASFCLMPLVITTFMLFIKKMLWKTNSARFLTIAFMAFIALAIAQPNALFSCLVFFACFLASFLYTQSFRITLFRNWKILAPICSVIGSAAIWFFCFNLPFLQSVIAYDWESDLSFVNALFNLGSLALTASVPQFLLVVLIPFGLVYLASKKMIWLFFPALFMAITYLECCCGSGFVKHLLGGFWYTDPSRLAANLVIFLVPIATAGLRLIIGMLRSVIKQTLNTLNLNSPSNLISVLIIIGFAVINFFPNYAYPQSDQTIRTPFGIVYQQMKSIFNTSKEQVYSSKEQEFVNEALSTISEEAIVINQPHDGSVFSYGINSINTYYRLIKLTASNETPESKLIRTSLCHYATDKEVQQAVQSIGAKYVLLLDQNREWDSMPTLPQSKSSENWIGIDSIDDSTPGFKVVLAEGDMRLYEIEPL